MSNKTFQRTTKTPVVETTEGKKDDALNNLMPTKIPDLSEPVVESQASVIDISYFQKYQISIADSPSIVQAIESRMNEYEERNSRNSNSTDQSRINSSLYLFNTLLRIFSAGEFINNCIDIVVAHFYQNKENIYHADFLYSHTHLITRDEEDRDTFMKLLSVFTLLANPAVRQGADTFINLREAIVTIPARYSEISVSLINYVTQQRA